MPDRPLSSSKCFPKHLSYLSSLALQLQPVIAPVRHQLFQIGVFINLTIDNNSSQ
jgi:hypothetical protein